MRFIIENCFVSYKGHKNTYIYIFLLLFFSCLRYLRSENRVDIPGQRKYWLRLSKAA